MKRIRATNPKTILKGALAKIRRGWTRGIYHLRQNGKMHYCSIGAINSCSRDEKSSLKAEAIFSKVLPMSSISRWNDDESRTKAEVVAAFQKAIALAD